MDEETARLLADLVVIATDLRDDGRALVARADRLYEEVIEVALAVRNPKIGLNDTLSVPPEPPEEHREPFPVSREELI